MTNPNLLNQFFYELGILRGWRINRTDIPGRVITACDKLFYTAEEAFQSMEQQPEYLVKPQVNMNIVDETKIAPSDHIAAIIKLVPEPENPKTDEKTEQCVQEEPPEGTSLDAYRNVKTVNVDLSIDDAKKRFPHFTEQLDAEFSPNKDPVEAETPDQEPVDSLIEEPPLFMPEGFKGTECWTAKSVYFLFNEREKIPATKWCDIGRALNKTGTQCQAKYINLENDGWIKKFRNHFNKPKPSAASAHAKEYAGKRDDKTLRQEDWLDIRYRHHTLGHSNTSIAMDYQVKESDVDTFIRMNDRKEAELAEQRLSGKNPGQTF